MNAPRYRIEASPTGCRTKLIDLKTGESLSDISKIEVSFEPNDIPRVTVHMINVEIKVIKE